MLQVYRRKVIFEISQAKYLAVIADESIDIIGQTQLVIVFRLLIKLIKKHIFAPIDTRSLIKTVNELSKYY